MIRKILANEMLTPRQADVLRFICDFRASVGWAPSLREIGDAMGISSPNGVVCHLTALEAKGWIRTGKNGESRAIAVLRRL